MIRREVVIVVRRDAGEFLALLRSQAKGGYWNPPAGGVEPGETPSQAAQRELAEETGLRVDVVNLDLELTYVRPDGGRVHVDAFAAEAPSGWEPLLDDEHVDHRWCSEADAAGLFAYSEPRRALHVAARRLEAAA
jgi:8-oxo-dGTP pyrophosphatase MutT (NUDIX family)